MFAEAVKNCENLQKCDILYSSSWFDPECLRENESNKLYLKIYCAKSSLRIFNRDFTKEQFSWVVFLANILSVFSFLIFLLNQKVAEKKLVKYHEKERATPSNYSLQIKKLPQGLSEIELITQLKDHFMKYAAEKKMKEEILPIFDIQVAQQNELIILNKKITDHEEAMSDLYEELKT